MSSQHIYMLAHCVHLLEILQKDEIESSPQEFNNINAKNQKQFLKGSLDIGWQDMWEGENLQL